MAEDETKLKASIIFVDGTFSFFKGPKSIKIIDEETRIEEECWEFYLKPTLKTRIKWNIKETDDNFIDKGAKMGYYIGRYKKEYCRLLDPSTEAPVWLISCDYKGNFIDIYNGEKTIWIEKMKTLRRQNETLQATNNSLRFTMIKIAKDPIGYFKKFSGHIKALVDTVNAPIITPPIGGGRFDKEEE